MLVVVMVGFFMLQCPKYLLLVNVNSVLMHPVSLQLLVSFTVSVHDTTGNSILYLLT